MCRSQRGQVPLPGAPHGPAGEVGLGLHEVVVGAGPAVGEQVGDRSGGVLGRRDHVVDLESTLSGHDRIGISSWSSTLLATVDAMHPRATQSAEQVVQILGGIGNAAAQSQATRLTGGLAQLTRAATEYPMAPGLLARPEMRAVLAADPHISTVLDAYAQLTIALVGVGSLQPSALLLGKRQRPWPGRAGGASGRRSGR